MRRAGRHKRGVAGRERDRLARAFKHKSADVDKEPAELAAVCPARRGGARRRRTHGAHAGQAASRLSDAEVARLEGAAAAPWGPGCAARDVAHEALPRGARRDAGCDVASACCAVIATAIRVAAAAAAAAIAPRKNSGRVRQRLVLGGRGELDYLEPRRGGEHAVADARHTASPARIVKGAAQPS